MYCIRSLHHRRRRWKKKERIKAFLPTKSTYIYSTYILKCFHSLDTYVIVNPTTWFESSFVRITKIFFLLFLLFILKKIRVQTARHFCALGKVGLQLSCWIEYYRSFLEWKPFSMYIRPNVHTSLLMVFSVLLDRCLKSRPTEKPMLDGH